MDSILSVAGGIVLAVGIIVSIPFLIAFGVLVGRTVLDEMIVPFLQMIFFLFSKEAFSIVRRQIAAIPRTLFWVARETFRTPIRWFTGKGISKSPQDFKKGSQNR